MTSLILDNPLLDVLNVKYVLSEHPLLAPHLTEIYRDADLRVYQRSTVLPRAFIASATVAPVAEQPLASPIVRETVFLETAPPDPARLLQHADHRGDRALICQYGPTHVTVDATLSEPGWVVLSDAYAEGWRATARENSSPAPPVDVPVYRADGALRAIYLPRAGSWNVEFTYRPNSFQVGLVISLASASALIAAAAGRSWRSWRARHRQPVPRRGRG